MNKSLFEIERVPKSVCLLKQKWHAKIQEFWNTLKNDQKPLGMCTKQYLIFVWSNMQKLKGLEQGWKWSVRLGRDDRQVRFASLVLVSLWQCAGTLHLHSKQSWMWFWGEKPTVWQSMDVLVQRASIYYRCICISVIIFKIDWN